jgi:chemotaxis protein MotB
VQHGGMPRFFTRHFFKQAVKLKFMSRCSPFLLLEPVSELIGRGASMVKSSLISFLIIILGFLIQGCVSAGTHKQLQDQYDKTAANLSDCQKKTAAYESKIHEQDVLTKDLESKLGSTKSEKLKLEGNVTEMKTALDALTKQRAEADQRIKEFQDLVTKFKSLTDTGKISVKIVDGQMVVALSSDVLFPSGSARLSPDGSKSIEEVTALLTAVPNRKFQVEGFTDNIPIKTAQFPSNWELASARALNVVKTMLDSGMPSERVSAASFGDTHPVQANDTDDGRAANRRIEIVVVPDLSTLPGYQQLQKMSGS